MHAGYLYGTHTILRSAFGESMMELYMWHRSVNYAAGAIGKRFNVISIILCATLGYFHKTSSLHNFYHPPSTRCDLHRHCALDMCNPARSFKHRSHTCVIRRFALLILGFNEQMSCAPLPATLYNLASQNSGLSTNLKFLRYEIIPTDRIA